MKKLSLIFSLIAVVLGLSSCNTDRDPVYQLPDQHLFKINPSPFANQYFELTPDGTFELTTSQPDYGFAAAATYSAKMSLTADFKESVEIVPQNDGASARMILPTKSVAEGILQLRGVTTVDEYNAAPEVDPRKLYFKAVCRINGVASSEVETENYICLNNVIGYCAIKEPRILFVVGDLPVSWGVDSKSKEEFINAGQILMETGVETDIYQGVVPLPAGSHLFRFYTALGDWGSDGALPSVGPLPNDNTNEPIVIGTDPTEYPAVPGKGSYNTAADFPGGDVTITVNMKSGKVSFQGGADPTMGKPFIYMVGAMTDWATPDDTNAEKYENWKLFDLDENGIYTATFQLEGKGDSNFRFAKNLGGWNGSAWIGCSNGNDYVINLPFDGTSDSSQNCWKLNPDYKNDKVKFTVNTNDNTVKFEKQ